MTEVLSVVVSGSFLVVQTRAGRARLLTGTVYHNVGRLSILVDTYPKKWYHLHRRGIYPIIGGMKVVESNLRVLVAEKEQRERRTLGIRTIAKESGASRSAVERLLNNTIKQVPLDDLSALCRWVPCDPGDVLKMVERDVV